MNQPVSFPIAKLLRLKGFDEPCSSFYRDGELSHVNSLVTDKKFITNSQFMTSRYFTAPSISDVVMWIYNTHRIWISPYEYRDHAADANDKFVFRTHQTGRQEFKSPSEAYEAAIKYVCEYKIK